MCKIFDTILGKIDPGYSEIRTFVQKELHFTRLLLCQKELEEGKIRREEYLAKTRHSMSALQDIDRQKKQLINFNCGWNVLKWNKSNRINSLSNCEYFLNNLIRN